MRSGNTNKPVHLDRKAPGSTSSHPATRPPPNFKTGSAHPHGPRGLGLSARLTEIPTLEERLDDLVSVLHASGSERATLFANADAGPPVHRHGGLSSRAGEWPDPVCDLRQGRLERGLSIRVDGRREIDTAGDGFLVWFDSPTAAIECARSILNR